LKNIVFFIQERFTNSSSLFHKDFSFFRQVVQSLHQSALRYITLPIFFSFSQFSSSTPFEFTYQHIDYNVKETVMGKASVQEEQFSIKQDLANTDITRQINLLLFFSAVNF